MRPLARSIAPIILALVAGAAAAQDAPWWEEQFVISTFSAVRHGDDLEKVMGHLADLHFNALESNTPLEYRAADLTGEEHLRVLDLAAQHGMRYFITDHERLTAVMSPPEEALGGVVADFGGHPGLGGYYVWDEPGPGHFATVRYAYQTLRKLDPDSLPLNAMVPSYGPHKWPDEYPRFARDFVQIVDPPVLSFDFYSVGKNSEGGTPTVAATLYRDLQLWSDLSLEHDKPLWFYPSAVTWGGVAEPTTATLQFQAATALAYGAKGIQWFMARDYTGGALDFTQGALNAAGDPGATYDAMKHVNGWLAELGPQVMTLEREEVAHTAPVPPDAPAFAPGFAGLNAASENLLLATHRVVRGEHEGAEYLWVVNRDLGAERTVRLEFAEAVALIEPIGKTEAYSGKEQELVLRAGEGRLVRVVK